MFKLKNNLKPKNMNALSPWALSAIAELSETRNILYTENTGDFDFGVYMDIDSVWVKAAITGGGQIAFRAAYSPGAGLQLTSQHAVENGIKLELSSVTGKHLVVISITPHGRYPMLHYTHTIIPAQDLSVPFWPKDILFLSAAGQVKKTTGKIHASQFGTRTGFIYMSDSQPKPVSMLYLQNLTALSDYCDQTKTSAGDTVGGEWPELGFSLPASSQPLKADKAVVVADAFVAFNEEGATDEPALMRHYLDMLASIYLLLPKPDTNYRNWPDIVEKGLKDLIERPGCWTQIAGHQYFNAYVSDYDTPPEIMVQLAVLLPLLDYVEWNGKSLEVMQTIKAGLPHFFDKELGTIMRWLPAAADQLKGEEEQKVPKVMDSWYLHHPLLNLSRLALKGDEVARQLFLDSLGFAIKVAHHFDYQWPVFYKMDTLETVKAETAEGKGGEKDVAGLYAHVMLQAWELTKEKRYLREAEAAAKTLEGYGFDIFYQANNTAFSAGALLRLYKITENELYLNLSYTCLAAVFRNMQLWDCNYGYGKNFPKFFSLYPLNDAPYTAAYEEQEVFCAFHDYLKHAEDVDILPSVNMLIAEYIRYMVDRSVYYYPPMLPAEMLEEKPKIGEIDNKLWIALEDLQDGWMKSGTVGQEVYGAGNAFGILPRHFLQVPGEDFMVYLDYPSSDFSARKGKDIHFTVLGDKQLKCRMMIVKTGMRKLPEIIVKQKGNKETVGGRKVKSGHLEFLINGSSEVHLSWSH